MSRYRSRIFFLGGEGGGGGRVSVRECGWNGLKADRVVCPRCLEEKECGVGKPMVVMIQRIKFVVAHLGKEHEKIQPCGVAWENFHVLHLQP